MRTVLCGVLCVVDRCVGSRRPVTSSTGQATGEGKGTGKEEQGVQGDRCKQPVLWWRTLSMQFDHDRMAVYDKALESLVVAAEVAANHVPPGCSFLGDQLRRATASISLKLAEASGEFRPKEKARFYRIARRSATECASILGALRNWPRPNDEPPTARNRQQTLMHAREQLIETVSMLSRLARRFDDTT